MPPLTEIAQRQPTSRFRWWRSVSVPQFELVEVLQLGGHIATRLDGIGNQAEQDRERLHDWVASQFTFPLRSLLIQANRNATRFVVLNGVIVGGGFITSAIAVAAGGGSASRWLIFGVGLVVAVAGALSQQLRLGFRSSERRTLAVALRQEGWAFANALGDYRGDSAAAFELFDQRVAEIHRRAAQVSALDAAPGAATPQASASAESAADRPTAG